MRNVQSLGVAVALAFGLVAVAPSISFAKANLGTPQSASFSVGTQYDITHVYVAPEDFDKFTDSFVATS
ncbi:hypothetical protein [Paraburkholderia sp. SIMBA_030]|uniref:hypothetical protein n=1 Tax=Paraburkholderia sp. SIMBA_030 TaxID=3085773 RepID=UPI003978F131